MGASWEPSWASCGSLGRALDPKMCKNQVFFKGFEKAVLWLFAAPNGSLGLILVRLGRIWFQNGFQNGSQKFSKMLSKVCQKMIRKRRPRGFQNGFQKFAKVRSPA